MKPDYPDGLIQRLKTDGVVEMLLMRNEALQPVQLQEKLQLLDQTEVYPEKLLSLRIQETHQLERQMQQLPVIKIQVIATMMAG